MSRLQLQNILTDSYTMKYYRKTKGNNGQVVLSDIKKSST